MKFRWLGQAGLLFDNGKCRVMIDPYLSDSVGRLDPSRARRVPICEALFETLPDVMIFTHDHLDHFDPETAERFLTQSKKRMTVLSPRSVFPKARAFGGGHNYVEFDRHTEWTEDTLRFRAVRAAHSDHDAIGVVIEELTTGKVYYITGDTLYNREIFADLPPRIDVIFLPINGVGNNMNVTDATRFAKDCGAHAVVPYHVGMLDTLTPDCYPEKNRILPKLYEEIEV